MTAAKAILRIVGILLLSLLIAYWIGFVGYTIEKLVAGGPNAVLGWYQHISATHRLEGLMRPWSWKAFLAQHFLLLLTTIALWFSTGRPAENVRKRET